MKNTTTLKRKIAAGMIAAVAAVSAFAVTASADSTQAGAAPKTAVTEQPAAGAAKYKVYKNDMTVKMYGEEFTHDEFEAFWVAVYKSFGADVTIEMVKGYTGSPHSEEWIRTGGPVFFADCWFQLHWYEKNDMMDTCHRYYIGKGWRSSEGWR